MYLYRISITVPTVASTASLIALRRRVVDLASIGLGRMSEIGSPLALSDFQVQTLSNRSNIMDWWERPTPAPDMACPVKVKKPYPHSLKPQEDDDAEMPPIIVVNA